MIVCIYYGKYITVPHKLKPQARAFGWLEERCSVPALVRALYR